MIVLDTNVLSELTRPTPDHDVARWFESCSQPLALSVITLQEISYGIARLPEGERRLSLAEAFLQLQAAVRDRTLNVTADIAIMAGTMQAAAAQRGRILDGADALIAGTCAAHTAALATRNGKDFLDLGLTVIDPWQASA